MAYGAVSVLHLVNEPVAWRPVLYRVARRPAMAL
jgi:hypothetical protein